MGGTPSPHAVLGWAHCCPPTQQKNRALQNTRNCCSALVPAQLGALCGFAVTSSPVNGFIISLHSRAADVLFLPCSQRLLQAQRFLRADSWRAAPSHRSRGPLPGSEDEEKPSRAAQAEQKSQTSFPLFCCSQGVATYSFPLLHIVTRAACNQLGLHNSGVTQVAAALGSHEGQLHCWPHLWGPITPNLLEHCYGSGEVVSAGHRWSCSRRQMGFVSPGFLTSSPHFWGCFSIFKPCKVQLTSP